MNLETQVAKILISGGKSSNTYVFVMAEKAFDDQSELYAVIELPVFNPAAVVECERIASALAASLKRSYRRPANENTFESALSQINEELAKLASLGQTHWIGKLNALVAAKTGVIFNIATTGKISALLFRDSGFTNVADSPKNPHPMKTFENFAAGKLRLHDFLILSTNQLFNYLSIDRLKVILRDFTLPLAGQQMIHILQDNAGPEVSFGTLVTLQVEPGSTPDDEINLDEYVAQKDAAPLTQKLPRAFLAAVAALRSALASLPQKLSGRFQKVPKLSVSNLSVKNIVQTNKKAWSKVKGGVQAAGNNFKVENFKRFSAQKKFFFITIVVLFIALIANLAIGSHYRKVRGQEAAAKAAIGEMQKLLNDANGALLYHADTEAIGLLTELQGSLEKLNSIPKEQKADADAIRQQVADLTGKVEKVLKVNAKTVATLGSADSLIKLPNIIAAELNRTIVSYNKATGAVQDGQMVSAEPIVASVYVKASQAVIYNGKNLYLWNFDTGILGPGFSENVPQDKKAAGLKTYITNNRVYTADTANNRILSFLVSDKGISKPVVGVASAGELSGARDLAVDGNIYVLANGGVLKYQSGKLLEFKLPGVYGQLKGAAKIYTDQTVVNIYILDPGNNRILVIDKKGGIVQTIISDQFKNLKDFVIDEKGRTIYVLDDASLLKFNF